MNPLDYPATIQTPFVARPDCDDDTYRDLGIDQEWTGSSPADDSRRKGATRSLEPGARVKNRACQRANYFVDRQGMHPVK